ncbi:TPA: DUF4118 domain-containing protein [Streptococcus suis]|nr:DUF4118 domain-containing protein [Streptococcus suis]
MKRHRYDFIKMLILVILATVLGYFFRYLRFPETTIVIVYLLAVVLTARLTKGYFYGIFSGVIVICAFNIFFTEPYFTLSVNDPTYFITFAVMAITSFIISTLTTTTNQMAEDAIRNEKTANKLYLFTNKLMDTETVLDIEKTTIETLSNTLSCDVSSIVFDTEDQNHIMLTKIEGYKIERCRVEDVQETVDYFSKQNAKSSMEQCTKIGRFVGKINCTVLFEFRYNLQAI